MINMMSPGASYGWRARFGMLKPTPVTSTNSHEFYLMAPDGVELFVTSLGVAGSAQSEYEKAVDRMDKPLQELLEHRPDVIVQAGVPLIATREEGFEEEVIQRVSKYTSVPFITDVGASRQAMSVVGCSHIAMLSGTFNEALADQVRGYLARAGVELVAARRVLETGGAGDVATLPLETVYRAARSLFEENPSIDGMWITHAAMPSVAIIDQLESDLGIPVISSSQALMWAGLRSAGIPAAIPGFGRLLRS